MVTLSPIFAEFEMIFVLCILFLMTHSYLLTTDAMNSALATISLLTIQVAWNL